ncbi:MAG: hypothetical protein H7Y38_02830 [Armatimonadetes bacterium]|nr:hypothetical protein [Armatimonadota bacterium]
MKNGYMVAAYVAAFVVCGAATTSAVLAQNATKTRKANFDSVYTKLNTGWKNDPSYKPAAIKEAEEQGQDITQVHAGFGGYSFRETYSARAAYRTVVSAAKPDYSLSLAVKSDELQICRDTVEWRTASGKPFAVIARIETFDGTDRGGGEFAPVSRTSQFLIVRGLRGYEYINADINAADKNANAKARTVADAAYRRGKK